MCFLPTSEKLSEELIAILDAESARGQVKEPQASHSFIAILKNTKGAVRRTHFKIRSEAHDTYILLAVVTTCGILQGYFEFQ